MVLTGILIVVYQRHYQDIDRSELVKGVSLAACSVFLTALGVVLMKPVLENQGFFWIVTLRLLAGAMGLMIYLILRKRLLGTIAIMLDGQHKWSSIMTASVLGSYLAMMFWLAGFKYADASVASVLNETSNIFVILMAWLFLKEELKPRKILGVVIAFTGVVVFIAA